MGAEHNPKDESDSESGMRFAFRRMKQDFADEGDSASEEESNQEDEMEEDEDENEGSDAEQNGQQIDAEMGELEKQYQNLHSEEQNLLKNLKRQKDEDAVKGQAVKNQKVLWDKTLELRFLLQKSFSNSNKLPQEPMRSLFCKSDEDIDQAYSNLVFSSEQTLSSILELQEALLEKNHSILQGQTGNNEESYRSKDSFNDEEWLQISNMHSRIAAFRNGSLNRQMVPEDASHKRCSCF